MNLKVQNKYMDHKKSKHKIRVNDIILSYIKYTLSLSINECELYLNPFQYKQTSSNSTQKIKTLLKLINNYANVSFNYIGFFYN